MSDEKLVAEALEATLAVDGCPPILRFFRFGHLPSGLRMVSAEFAELAVMVAARSNNEESVTALRKLLEAKDAAVRAVLP